MVRAATSFHLLLCNQDPHIALDCRLCLHSSVSTPSALPGTAIGFLHGMTQESQSNQCSVNICNNPLSSSAVSVSQLHSLLLNLHGHCDKFAVARLSSNAQADVPVHFGVSSRTIANLLVPGSLACCQLTPEQMNTSFGHRRLWFWVVLPYFDPSAVDRTRFLTSGPLRLP